MISLDFISAIFGLVFVALIWIMRSHGKKSFPIGDMITTFFVGILVPVSLFYFYVLASLNFPELANLISGNIYNPVYLALIGLVLLRYAKDFWDVEVSDSSKEKSEKHKSKRDLLKGLTIGRKN
ncbi:MAG TPA: hypothetical protein VGQ00_03295 [Candidatus Norongarragalinales archaeon]|jgi:hypothetical protein|nr:hypothetical protein [Candidatus Norongarragalinales archaeon]